MQELSRTECFERARQGEPGPPEHTGHQRDQHQTGELNDTTRHGATFRVGPFGSHELLSIRLPEELGVLPIGGAVHRVSSCPRPRFASAAWVVKHVG
jgi:hypothetical protein